MPINNDISDLPAATARAGEAPSPEALRYLESLAQAWYEQYLGDGNDERAFAVPGTRFRASWAGGCARSLSYEVLEADAKTKLASLPVGEPIDAARAEVERWKPTNPPTLADAWRMGLGSKVHELFQEVFERVFPTATCEVAVDLRPDVDGSATVDILLAESCREPGCDAGMVKNMVTPLEGETCEQCRGAGIIRTLIELKTANGYSFKLQATPFKGPAEGPKMGAKLQAALAGRALNCDRIIIGYLSMECISKGEADRHKLADVERFLAGWVYERDEFEPWAEREIKRINKVLELLDGGTLAPRAIFDGELPAKALVENPLNGFWTVRDGNGDVLESGTTWWCGYCWHRDRCIEDGPGMVPVAVTLGGST